MLAKLSIVVAAMALALSAASAHAVALLQSDVNLITSRSAGSIAIDVELDTLGVFEITPGAELIDVPNSFTLSSDGRLVAVVATTGGIDAPIRLIVVTDGMFRTADGIGVGSTVAATESAYGTAILSHGAAADSVEVVSVSSGPAGVQFVTSTSGQARAGIYADQASITTDYDPAATISSIWIDCRTRTCPEPAPVAEAVASTDTDTPQELAVTGPSRLGALVGFAALGGGLAILGARNLNRMFAVDARCRVHAETGRP